MSASFQTRNLTFIAGAAVSVVVALEVVIRLHRNYRLRKQRVYPPGPKPRFLVGNLFDLPTTRSAEVYMEWGKKYNSDLLFASAFGTNVLILNSVEHADELFEHRSSQYSDRPPVPMFPYVGFDCNTAALPYGPRWKRHRRVFTENLKGAIISQYHPLLYKQVYRLTSQLLTKPVDFFKHVKLFAMSVPLGVMYGYEVESFDDPAIVAAENSMKLGAKLILPGATIANIFPVLLKLPEWVPGAGFKKLVNHVYHLTQETKRIPLDFVKRKIEEGTPLPSVVAKFLERKLAFGATAEEEQAVLDVAYTTYGGAAETSHSGIISFMYAMTVWPEAQRKAQEEIDRVVGRDRMPTFEDKDSLPYTVAIYREVMRLWPPTPLTIPRVASEDDVYKGYFIPKDTVILTNVMAMDRDERRHKNPNDFFPDRYLNPDGTLNEDSRSLVFGFGRRICAGRYFASDTVWLIVATLLAAFKFERKMDTEGKEIPLPSEPVDYGTFYQFTPFEADISPRCEEMRRLLEVMSQGAS